MKLKFLGKSWHAHIEGKPGRGKEREIEVGLLAVAVIVIIAVLLTAGSLPTRPGPCSSALDCTGAHQGCDGMWQCISGNCEWTCGEPRCQAPSDCEGLAHVQCAGAWTCEENRCGYSCEVGSASSFTYGVSECREEAPDSIEFVAAADGIRMAQSFGYSCCANIGLSEKAIGNLIKITERNAGEVCDCFCSYEITAEIKTLPGNYRMEVYGPELQKLGEGDVTVGSAPGRVLFIDQYITQEGTSIAGSWPVLFLDYPSYTFDESTRVLSGVMGFDPVGVKAIFGSGMTVSGDMGNGTRKVLTAVNGTPFTYGDYQITRIWDDGKVAVYYNNETITLAPGESWSERKTEDKADANQLGLMRIKSENRITNYGFIEIARMERRLSLSGA